MGLDVIQDQDGTITYMGSGAEEELLVVPGMKGQLVHSLSLSAANLTQVTTFRIYMEIDNAAYDLRYGTGPLGGTIVFDPATDGKWIQFQGIGVADHNVRVTAQSAVAEGAPRDIAFSLGYNA